MGDLRHYQGHSTQRTQDRAVEEEKDHRVRYDEKRRHE
jgi:hypothetical protein